MSSAATMSAPDPSQLLMQLATGYMPAACLAAVTQAGIADALASGPQSTSVLAGTAKVNEDSLYRMLRALASIGVFTEIAPRTFANSTASELLIAGRADSQRDFVLWIADSMHLRVYSNLAETLRNGGTTIKHYSGMEFWDYAVNHPETMQLFNNGMTSISKMTMAAILDAYDFSGMGTLADVAGGHGALLTGILKKHTDLQGILFDLPHVADVARTLIAEAGVLDRCQIVGGDFFQSLPEADSYLLKLIIHDWDDAEAIKILKQCVQSMRGNGKVLLAEFVLTPGNTPDTGKWIDIEMLALPGGRERTEEEYAALFSRAGLRLNRIIRTASPLCLIEAVKA
jgi:hypothetical protein